MPEGHIMERTAMRRLPHLLTAGLVLACSILMAQDDDRPAQNVQEVEAAGRARAIGFGDLEVDNLHGSVTRRLTQRIAYGDLPLAEGSDRDFMKGRDSSGAVFYRLRLREGTSFGMEVHPVAYIFKAHCYLYPAADGKGLSRVVFQFYRINFSGVNYTRELRRFIHPDPRDLVQGDRLKQDIKMLDNSKLLLEQYEEPSTTKPIWEGIDGIPLPLLTITPKQKIELNDPKDLMPFEKQVRVINAYKRLLRSVDQQLYELNRERYLDRLNRIENILDFPA